MDKTIGIIGGMGPAAGVDLARKNIDQTTVSTDQEHIPFILASFPAQIADRTGFLLEGKGKNPGEDIAVIIRQLEEAGASVIGMACNTAHAGSIIKVVHEDLEQRSSRVRFVHMIEEVAVHIQEKHPGIKRVGILSTSGTYYSRVYPETLAATGLEAVVPSEPEQKELVNESIFNRAYGIKAHSVHIKDRVRENIGPILASFKEQGAGAVVLGCTEFSLVYPKPEMQGLAVVDSNLVLARALIKAAGAEK